MFNMFTFNFFMIMEKKHILIALAAIMPVLLDAGSQLDILLDSV